MNFDFQAYGPPVAEILALDGRGERLMPLALGTCSSAEARRRLADAPAAQLFAGAAAPEAALAGLWLYFSCLDESHAVAQDVHSSEGSFWHGIMHRQEPDPGNSAYWFRRTGNHAIFPELLVEAGEIAARFPDAGFRSGSRWDPFAFIDFCESARRKPTASAHACALEIQRAEWQLLFDYCARPIAG